MTDIDAGILKGVLGASIEPLLLVRLDHTDWPVVFANEAMRTLTSDDLVAQPFADAVESIVGRELALELSESLRARHETSFPAEIGSVDYLLVLKPIAAAGGEDANHCAIFWRRASGKLVGGDADSHHALLRAKRQIRDLKRDDPVTGLLNDRAFREVLAHDWAVAARERSTLALVMFSLDDFDAYVQVFGKHASDSCVRRVGQAIRRCLRRASDVAARYDDRRLVVLSHASDEAGVRRFAERIARSVRELGLHHPRSSRERFVTVSHTVVAATAGEDGTTAEEFLGHLLEQDSAPA